MELGKQTAKIVDYGLTENKSGNGSVFVKFEFATGETLSWFGSLKEGKAAEITLSTLFECGFNGDDVSELSNGIGSNLLITDEEIDVLVVREVDGDGKERTKIKYVGTGKEIQRVDKEKAKSLVGASVNLQLREMKKSRKPRDKKDPNFEIPFGN